MKGQVMLVTILALSGTILGATTIAGLLMLYQIRQSADAGNSAKAIYAADAGLERQLYELFKNETCDAAMRTLFNDAVYESSCEEMPERFLIKSQGTAGNVSRAFEASVAVPEPPAS